MSNASKGQYWKMRTKRWLETAGYQVAFLERVGHLQTPRGLVPIKRDQLASDLLAVNAEEIVFVQVKGGDSRRSGLAAARTAFAQYAFPAGTQQWIVLWAPRARLPEVVVVSQGPCGAVAERLVARTGRRPKARLPLFEPRPVSGS